ncbi:bromodomain adjacent to zinc finger domain protein 2A isoform X2 [Takifugu rubripes]|nr:bromodomain adjacent to zinc finger domain protein 2A isoform X2 [Takifugu rubripes]XP_029689731.1 bromodomain adjacent to zinc finger domain protein 2A isoform X2 [Takifugu rubripes]
MESNNRFNYGSNSSANSGLKRSSGDSLYTNGSSMSFPPQGKNMNGEMNVNGATTVHGSSVPGSHPPAAPYPHVSNHLQSSAGYDYLWGGHPQYGPSMGSSAGHGMHQKQPAPGMAQPQSQHHFQGHGQYQLNGGVESSHQSSVAGPPTMPHTGSQYWNRNNPGPQMSYNSHSMFGSYQTPTHPGLAPSAHHKQQQSLQQPPHQPSQQHIHSHPHQPQQHQQPQHYGMLPNGMPYYQHQPQHTSLPPSQHQQQPAQPQGQVQMLQPAAQNFTPPRGSPQPHSLARGGTGSPLPAGMSSATLMSSSTMQDSGSPKGRSPHAGNMGTPAVVQGHVREPSKDVDLGYNGTERGQSSQILSTSDAYQPKSTAPMSDYRQHSEQPAAQCPEMAPSPRESVMNTPPRSTSHASVSPSLSKDATPPRVSAIPALSLCPASGSGTPTALCRDAKSSSPPPNLSAAPSRHSSSPVRVQGFRSEMPPAGPESVSPGKMSTHPSATAPGLPLPPSALLSASLQRPKPQLMTTQHDKPAVPNLLSPGSSAALKSSSAGADAAVASVSSLGSRPHESRSTYTPPAVSAHLSASLAASIPTVAVTSAAPESPTAQPSPTLPLPTTQASRTAPVSTPHNFLSALASSASSGALQSSNAEQSCPNSAVPQALRISSPEQEPHKVSQTSVSFEQIQAESGVSPASQYPGLDHTPVRRSPHFHRVEHSTDDESFNNSSQYEGYSSFATPSRIDVSSILENSSLMHDGSSCADKSTDSDTSFLGTRQTSLHDRTSRTEAGDSTDMDTTRGSVCSSEASRSNLLDSTKEGGMSETQRTVDSWDSGTSILESSLNSSQVQDSSVASADVSRSHSFVSPQQSQKGPEEVWENKGHDTSDSAGRISIKTTVCEKMTPPSFSMKDQNFIAFSTAAEGPAVHPLQPITDQVVPAAEGFLKSKTRKPRGPKALWTNTSGAGEAQRKPRVRASKVEKTEEAAKGRKRKKPVKQEMKDCSDAAGAAGPPAGEIDPITATIDAVLANAASIDTSVEKLKKLKRTKKCQEASKQDGEKSAEEDDNEEGSTAGETKGRRVATEEQVQFPLQHGWKREIRVKKIENRMKAETWYYTPCGRRMKQFPEIIKYLKKHADSLVSREHFSFSPRMPVGDFYEERESPEGVAWVLLANEEVPSMIMAITGRRGRPPNPDKEKPSRVRGPKGGRRPGRPPKTNMVDLLSKVDAKLLKRLEAKEALTEEEKEKLAKIKKKMKRKARMKRMEDTKMKKMREEKRKAKLEQESKALEGKLPPPEPLAQQATQPAPESAAEAKKPGRRRSVKAEPAPTIEQTDEERLAQGKRVPGARSKAKALAKAQAEAAAAAQAAVAAKRAAERRAQAQKRLEERKRQQLITEELKKPTEDMCLTDHKPLPELSRVPGVVLSGAAFSHCLAVVEFLHAYGKLIGLDIPKDIPSLATLQEGLLGLAESQGAVQDLLMKLVEAALHDPGLPSYYQSVKILGDKLVELQLTRGSVSEVLRIFLESHGYDTDVCNTMRTKTFHSLPPDTKAAILGFLVDELNGSNIVTNDIDNTLENMTTWRKNKWIIEGKLRKLKSALARRTGRSAEDICFEERRRSARVAEEENLSLEESGLVLERGSRRARKEEPKLSDTESPSNASIPELERQIDKLTKRQAFFRKKLLQSSHTMRAALLGQDRYRRRYLMLPHLGGVLVEGPEELLTSGDVLIAEVPVTFLKKEPKVEENPVPATPHSTSLNHAQPQALSPEEDPLPDTTSLMCRPRGRGRPRKIKPEVELHLRTAKIRRRRRNSVKSGSEEGPGSPNSGTQDLTQNAFQSWLSHSQDGVVNGTCSAAGSDPEGSRPEESVKDMAEKQGQWFTLLPKQPCDDDSLTEPQIPASPGSPPKLLPQIPTTLPPLPGPPTQPDLLSPDVVPAEAVAPAPTQDVPPAPPEAPPVPDCSPLAPPHLLPASTPLPKPAPATPSRPVRRRRRGSRGSSPARRGARGAAAKRRGRPPNSVFQELEQQYFTQLVVKPIPASMVRGWWWIKDPEELYSILQALHPRGVRERVLHKHLAKHMENLAEVCTKPISDRLFDLKVEDKDVLLEELQKPWQVQEKTMETDIGILKWVEDLEQRVVSADLHLKALPQLPVTDAESSVETPMGEFQPYTIPDPDSTRDDLQYYEHDANPHDDWIIRTKKEWSGLPRIATHPLDLAVLRLANLERNIERRYLKEPLWNPAEVMRLAPLTPTPGEEHPMDVISLESEITSRLRTWRQALDRCRSAPQVCLCLLQLEKAIAWERSVTRVTCQVCRKGDNDDCLLLCDGCDRGCHMYCLKPKITQVPEGDWFCPTCVDQTENTSVRLCKKRTRMKKKRYEDESSEDEVAPRRSGGMATRHKEAAPASSSRSSAEAAAKRRRMTTRNQPDLTFCEIILMEMEAHADAWPFLEPVNPRLVPGYRRIVKNPMDFLTMRERLLQGEYNSCEEFAADAQLVFNNCELFNEDTSEVGTAGHAMRRFFESRWAEFYSNKDK